MNETDLIKIFSEKIYSLKTGSISADDLINDSLIIQSLELAKTATHGCESRKEKETNKTLKKQEENLANDKPKNMGCPWTLTSRHQLINQFNDNTPINIIATNIERTVGSVEAQLVKEGLMREEETTYYKNSHASAQTSPSANNQTDFRSYAASSTLNDQDYPF